MKRFPLWGFCVPAAFGCSSVLAADVDRTNVAPDFFRAGRYEVALMSGLMFSPIGADRNRATEDYTLTVLQLGRMLSDVSGSGWLRGNWELALEAFGGAVVKGTGSYVAGGTLWGRYNFVQADWRVVPYFQLGAGAGGTDMDRRLVGETFNFNLDAAAGMRWFISQNWALNVECRYQHTSNATIAKHDLGVNAIGPSVGISFFF